MKSSCKSCRFWLAEEPVEEGAIVFGPCRRHPTRVLGELAALGVPRQVWGRDQDPDEDLWSTQIYRASPFPITESDDWCGEYERGRPGEEPEPELGMPC